MAPSLRDIRHAASKKRKAVEADPNVEKKAVAKIPKRVDTARPSAIRIKVAKPLREREVVRDEAANPSRDREHVKVDANDSGNGEAVRPEPGEEVTKSPASVTEPPALIPTINVLDSSPEQAARASSPPAEAVRPDTAPTSAAPGPVIAMSSGQDMPNEPPAAVAPKAGDAASSSGTRNDINPSLRSILDNHSRWAERALEGASVVEVQELLRHQRRATFFREASVAHLWALNSLIAMRDLWTLSDTAIDQAREEMLDLQGRAERAEMALEDTRSTLKDKAEAARLRAEQAEYALEVAQRKAAHELDSALVAEENQKKAEEGRKKAEEKLATVESEMHTLLDKLHSTAFELNIATKKAERAEEAARLADVEIAALKVASSEAEKEAAGARKEAAEAVGRVFEAEKKATEAVEIFRKSRAFDEELAESTAFAYNGGFQDCKEKVKRLYNLEGIEALEPDEPSEGDDLAP